MQDAITRGALLSRQLLDTARPCPESIGGFVAGSRLAALAGTLDQALRPDVTVRTDIAPDLWDFDADPEELYFALLNLCRNSADGRIVWTAPGRQGESYPAHNDAIDSCFRRLAIFAMVARLQPMNDWIVLQECCAVSI